MRRMQAAPPPPLPVPRPALPPTLQAALLALHTQLTQRVQHLPPTGSRPLVMGGKVAGWVSAPALYALADLPHVRVTTEALVLLPDLPDAFPPESLQPAHIAGEHPIIPTFTPVLAQIAAALHNAGCLKHWRNESLDVIGEGVVLGTLERAAFRPLGLLTRAVRLNAWTQQGELWIARRAANKATDPGKWDTLACGLIAANESPQQALLRESHEEAGLPPEHLPPNFAPRLVSRLHKRVPEGYLVEDMLVSHCVLDDHVQPRNLDGEVQTFCRADRDALWELLKTDAFTAEAAWAITHSLLAGA